MDFNEISLLCTKFAEQDGKNCVAAGPLQGLAVLKLDLGANN